MARDPIGDVEAYWASLRGPEGVPDWADFDIAAMAGCLGHILVVDLAGGGDAVAIAGAKVEQIMGRGLYRESFSALWREPAELAAALAAVRGGAAATFTASGAPAGRRPETVKFMMLPFRRGAEKVARAVVVVAMDSRPAWLGLLPLEGLAEAGLGNFVAAE
jgi:hypothetical protein